MPVINGDDGNNVLFDTAGDDTINGLDGDDSITVTAGNDSVNGGNGTDTLIVNYGGTSLAITGGFNGFATNPNEPGAFGVAFTQFERFVVTTGSGNDSIQIAFLDGNDVISTGAGDDFILTNSGDDTVNGGADNDLIDVGTGNDSADGGTGNDRISANMTSATSAIVWNLQTNFYSGPIGSFTNFEYFGIVSTGSGNDTVVTGTAALNDTVNLGDGNDSVTVSNGNDSANGGDGLDTLVVDYGWSSVAITGGFNGFAGAPLFGVAFTQFERFVLTTGSGNDTIQIAFPDGNDIISTGAGDDYIESNTGDDLLNGGAGKDTLNGGGGGDTFVYNSVADSIVGAATRDVIADFEAGTDRIDLFAIDANTVLAGVQAFSFIGGGAFSQIAGELRYSGSILAGDVDGDGLADFEIEFGNAAAITASDLSLLANNLVGGAGNNRLLVGPGSNGYAVDGGAGFDTLAVGGTVNALGSITGMEAIDLASGSTLTLTGAQLASGFILNTAVTGTGALTINMTAGKLLATKLFAISSGVTVTINGTSGTDIMKLANAVQTVSGGDGTDQIKGGSQVDTISGGNGNDKIMGLGGADILTGEAGNDVFRFLNQSDSGIGANADRVTDFAIGQDRLNFVKIDADAVTAGDQAFAFLGNAAFGATGTGQIRYQDSGADLLVQVDVNGDGTADMEVILQGLSGQALTGADFVL